MMQLQLEANLGVILVHGVGLYTGYTQECSNHGALRARMFLNHGAGFAQECQMDGALRARGLIMVNGRKNHSLKEERTSTARAPRMSIPPSMSDFFDHFGAKLPKLKRSVARSAPSVGHSCAKCHTGRLFSENSGTQSLFVCFSLFINRGLCTQGLYTRGVIHGALQYGCIQNGFIPGFFTSYCMSPRKQI